MSNDFIVGFLNSENLVAKIYCLTKKDSQN